MEFKIPATALSIKPDSFKDSEGKDVNFHHIVMLVDGEVVEVNTTDPKVVEYVEGNLTKEQSYILSFVKNRYGAYKIKINY